MRHINPTIGLTFFYRLISYFQLIQPNELIFAKIIYLNPIMYNINIKISLDEFSNKFLNKSLQSIAFLIFLFTFIPN